MGRTKARLVAILGVAIALALPPRMALASEFVKFEYIDLNVAPLALPAEGMDFSLPNASLRYPVLPYSLPYTDVTSSSFAESGSAHSDLMLTEQEYTIDLNQFDAKLKFWVPTLQMSPTSTQTGFTFPNPYKTSSTVISGTFNWPNNFYISGASGGTGAWAFDGRFYDDNGYFYSKDDQFTVNEHDSTGEVATDFASEGASTGTIAHDAFLADGLYFTECPFPEASSDGYSYFFVGFGESRSGGSQYNYFKKGTRFFTYSARFNYWRDDWSTNSALNLYVWAWCYRSGNNLHASQTFDYNSFTLPSDADVVGLILRTPAPSGAWSSRCVLRPPSIYMVDPIVENTIIEETEEQTETLMDTTGSGSIFSGLLDTASSTLENNTGFLGQLSTVTAVWTGVIDSGSASGVVQFPGVVVLGQTLIPAQSVDIWQYGLENFQTPIRAIWTFMFTVAWVNGMKHLWEVQVLGYENEGELSRMARMEAGLDPDIPF